jgi:carbamoyl-phosphate synthase large subunit
VNILLTSVGYRGYLIEEFKQALAGKGKVFAGDHTPLSPALYAADEVLRFPKSIDAAYIDNLLNECLTREIRLIIPLSDLELPIMSRHRARFAEKGIELLVSDTAAMEICRDKWLTFKHLSEAGLGAPQTVLTPNEALREIAAGRFNWPLLVKPRRGSASRGQYKVSNESQLRCLWSKDCVIQEWLEAPEYGLDILTDFNGQALLVIPRRKLVQRAGETDKAVSVKDQRLINVGQTIVRIMAPLGLRGPIDVDFMLPEDGTPRILEINPRFGGGYPVASLAGGAFPDKILRLARGEALTPNFDGFADGVVMLKQLSILHLTPAILPPAWSVEDLPQGASVFSSARETRS